MDGDDVVHVEIAFGRQSAEKKWGASTVRGMAELYQRWKIGEYVGRDVLERIALEPSIADQSVKGGKREREWCAGEFAFSKELQR